MTSCREPRSSTTDLSELEAVLAWSGFADGPSQALRDYLLMKGARAVTTIAHPLTPDGPHHHEITYYAGGATRAKRVRTPVRPPITYPADVVVPLRVPRCDLWVGFNSLAVARGLLQRRRGRAKKVVSWHVDFVPERFGRSLTTIAYDKLDKLACVRSDSRVELSHEALDARNERHSIDRSTSAPAAVVPMGAWTGRLPHTKPDAHLDRRVVYMGHLVPRQGVATLLHAVRLALDAGVALTADIIGTGPEFESLTALANELGISDVVRFHGFLPDHEDVEAILAGCAIAVAPYVNDPKSFTRYADPGKLKAYLAAGLPIVMTAVPPNAHALAAAGAAVIVEDSPAAFARALGSWLDDPARWSAARTAALDESRGFDWSNLFDEWFATVDLIKRS